MTKWFAETNGVGKGRFKWRFPGEFRNGLGGGAFMIIELVALIALILIVMSVIIAAIQRARSASLRLSCLNKLKQIGLGLQQYHDAAGNFPPGVNIGGQRGYQFLGWPARLLPFIEQDSLWAETTQAFRKGSSAFRNPPHLGLSTVLPSFSCPADARVRSVWHYKKWEVALCSFLGVEGTNLSRKDGILYLNSGIRINDVSDGLSNTLLVGERPPSADMRFGWWYAGIGQLGVYANCPPGPYKFSNGSFQNVCDSFHFWSPHGSGANFLFADGSARFLSYASDQVIPALATRAGGEIPELPW